MSANTDEPAAGHGLVGRSPDACSILSATYDEPIAGSAATATTWLCIEQPGPYGADALVESHFDVELGGELAARAKGTGVRIQLIRRPGRHADAHPPDTLPGGRRVFVAHTGTGATWLRAAVVDDPRSLLDLDLAALTAGEEPLGWGERLAGPVLLVCSNGRRDLCCALVGRPLAGELARRHAADDPAGGTVWETTHTGGHRFAPTAVLLPTGYLYGRLDVDFAEHVLAEARAGRMVTERCRGRSTWSAPGQVAELAVRELTGETDPDAVRPEPEVPDASGWRVRVVAGGRAWTVTGREETLRPDRKTSCAKAPLTPTAHVVTEVGEAEPAGVRTG
ncbi:sucrase ferredoxin [Actinopolymorpha sp. NPDC004070]|uniref:sucrase ferredoxin n=1 Tax=Actinopolymorpha sp. NPDC004070 TaxID=3154548 RepID=UPI0033B2133D